MQTVKITRVFSSDTKKDTGEKYKDKNGKPFYRVGIQTDKTGDDWYSTIAYDSNSPEMQLEEGQEVDIVFEEKNGYKNFKLPSKLDTLEKRVEKLERLVGGDNQEYSDDTQEVNVDEEGTDELEDMPF